MSPRGAGLFAALSLALSAGAQDAPTVSEAGAPPASETGGQGESRFDRLYEVMSRADGDQDGAVSRGEMAAMRTDVFDRIDTDADGLVDPDALPRPEAGPPAGGGRFARFGARDPMAEMDANGDGVIARAEFVEAEPRWFSRADADNDGSVTVGELDAFVERMERLMQRWGGGPEAG